MEIPSYGQYAGRDWPEPDKGLAALISRLDVDVGALVSQVDALGLSRDTLFIFTSDNGPHREGGNTPGFFASSGPFRGIKRDLYEGGGAQAVRFGAWKAVRKPIFTGDIELYDLGSDPGEQRNLAADAQHVVEQARRLLERAHTPDPRWTAR